MPKPDPSEFRRCFVALRPARDQLDTVVARTDALRSLHPELGRELRFVRPVQLHLTLAFLGALPANRVDELITSVESAANEWAPFELAFGRLSGFPSLDRARVAWLDLRAGREAVVEAAATVRSELRSAGLPYDDRPFRPHLTVARARRGPVRLDGVAELDTSTPITTATEVEVLRSDLTDQGASHHLLARIRFGGAELPALDPSAPPA